MKYITTIHQIGNNTGIKISEEQLEKLGGGKRPLVVVTLNNHTYRCAVGKMNNEFLISLSAENREKAKVNGGDTIEVDVQLDTKPRTVQVPEDLQDAFKHNEQAKVAFDKLAPSKKKAIVSSITGAKLEETRQRRMEKIIASLNV